MYRLLKIGVYKRLFLLVLIVGGVISPAGAQDVAVKTNILYDATLTVNAGVEYALAPRWSVDLSGNYNGWAVNGHKWKHWLAQPEARYWFCDHFAGHFVGLHALGGQYNFGNFDTSLSFLGTDYSVFADERHQGWYVGAGIAYGYSFILNRHLNLELEIGVGYVYTRYDTFNCEGCGRKVEEDQSHHYVGPTKAAVNLVYVF